jgi:hypothetical protein
MPAYSRLPSVVANKRVKVGGEVQPKPVVKEKKTRPKSDKKT